MPRASGLTSRTRPPTQEPNSLAEYFTGSCVIALYQTYAVTLPTLKKTIVAMGNDMHGLLDSALLLLALSHDAIRRRTDLVSSRIEGMEWPSGDEACVLLSKREAHQLCAEQVSRIYKDLARNAKLSQQVINELGALCTSAERKICYRKVSVFRRLWQGWRVQAGCRQRLC